ncbi:MAG TPA: MFS transporter, partial [Nitrososphaera sp.]|nr:MFS transporter [Nitrososphaera sp.]
MQKASLALTSRNWSWFLIPMNASSTGISTIIPIYMLALGGQVREVAIAVFLSNLATTLGAIFWGRLIDIMHWRSTIIAICSAAVAITAASLYFVSSIPVLMLLSAVVGFFSVGPAPVTNLLVMEKTRREDWLKTYSWTSLVSAAGLVIAMVAGYLWLLQYEARTYAIVCSAIAISSLALTIVFVKDPKMTLDRRALLRSPALFYRLRQVPMIFLRPMPELSARKIKAGL